MDVKVILHGVSYVVVINGQQGAVGTTIRTSNSRIVGYMPLRVRNQSIVLLKGKDASTHEAARKQAKYDKEGVRDAMRIIYPTRACKTMYGQDVILR